MTQPRPSRTRLVSFSLKPNMGMGRQTGNRAIGSIAEPVSIQGLFEVLFPSIPLGLTGPFHPIAPSRSSAQCQLRPSTRLAFLPRLAYSSTQTTLSEKNWSPVSLDWPLRARTSCVYLSAQMGVAVAGMCTKNAIGRGPSSHDRLQGGLLDRLSSWHPFRI